MAFCKEFNAKTQGSDMIIPVVLTVYSDRSFSMLLKTPPTSVLLKKAAGLATSKKPGSGSKEPNKVKIGRVTMKQVRDLAEQKMPDMNCTDIEAAIQTVMGTARSMGIDVVEA
jgi:large subunit ribosomal protein L11